MPDQSQYDEPNDPRVAAALREYLERVDRGEPVDREAFVGQHAEIADELRSLLTAEGELRRLAESSQRSQETVPPKSRPKILGGLGGNVLTGQFGRYRIVRALGSGAMGTVYLAQDTQLGRQVALKTPHFQDDPSGELLKRFYREAQAAATLRHPNICPVHDVGEIEKTHYISMAYIEGNPLSAFVRSKKPQPERQVLALVRKLALALQEAHDHKIVHRDLKPDNIMVDKRGEPLIMDFGLAQQVRPDEEVRLTRTGTLVGTPAYMSPEQVDGDIEKIGPLTDEYSLGVILYELLTGQLPFRGSMLAVLGQIITKDAPTPSEARPGLDPRTDAICKKMMAKKPSGRFPSLAAVAEELATILKNPAGSSASVTKPTAGLALPASSDAAAGSGAGSAATSKVQNQKVLTASDLTSLEDLARKCLVRHDYDQLIQFVEQVPEEQRSTGLQTALEKARTANDEIAFLLVEIDEAVRLNDARTALKKADELLTIKRGHRRALEVQQQFAGAGHRGVVGLEELKSELKKGGWIPWSALAFGVAVLVATAAGLFLWLGRTVLVIDADRPGLTVSLKGNTEFVTVSGRQSTAVAPGKQELTVSAPGLESVTRTFPIDKGHMQRVTVTVVDNRIVLNVEGQTPEIVAKADNPPPAVKPQAPPPKQTEQKPKAAAPKPPKPAEKQLAAVPAAVATKPANPSGLLIAPFDEATAKKAQLEWAERLKVPVEITNSLGMKLRLIPPGDYTMGAPDAGDSMIPHHVRITRPFYAGVYEVTRGEFKKFASAFGFKTRAEQDKGGLRLNNAIERTKLDKNHQYTWRSPGFAQDDTHPVVDVSWDDMQTFCEWLSRKEGKRYRLPTEAEWEYAARAGTTHWNYNGGDYEHMTEIGNIPDATAAARFPGWKEQTRSSDGFAYTSPVGQFRPNNFGLYDTLGNVFEQCSDWHADDYYHHSPEDDPSGPPGGTLRVARGGSFRALVAVHGRWGFGGGDHLPDLGFRVVCEIPANSNAAPPPVASTAPAAVPATTTGFGDEKFVPLFNGHDLTGWIKDPNHPRDWRVENGILVCPGGRGAQSILYSQRDDFKNFHLRIEARLSGTEFSGLYFRVEMPPAASKDRVPVTGYRVDLRAVAKHDDANTGSIWAIGLPGHSMYWGAKNGEPIAQPGQWFTLDLIVDGYHTMVLINGRKVADDNWTPNHTDQGTGRIALKRVFEERVVQPRKIEIRKIEIAEF